MRTIFGILAKSPFGGLTQHTDQVHQTVLQLRPLMDAFMAEEWERTVEITKSVYKLEHQADLVKDEIRKHLPRSLFLPVDRGDLLRFLHEQDAIADRVEDVGDHLTMRRTPTPGAVQEPVSRLVEQVIQTSQTWYSAAAELQVLQEASFAGPEATKVMELVAAVNHQEWEADKYESAALKALFELENELGAVSVLVWMRIIETIGRVADHAENTADLLRLMMARG